MCVEQSTNIVELLGKVSPIVIEYDQWLATEKVCVTRNIIVIEEHFVGRGVAVAPLKNEIKNELAKSRKDFNAQAIADAKNKLVSIAVSGGPNRGPNEDPDKKRIINKITKTEFFKKVKDHYEHYRDGIYRRKRNAKGIEDAEYIEWDNLHNDVEAYGKNKYHIGSIDPQTLKLYKGPVPPRRIQR